MSVIDFADCPFPVLNGTFILSSESRQMNNFPDNSKAFVECARGLKGKEGSNSISCTNGKWSDPELKCESNSFLNWTVPCKQNGVQL